MSTSPLPLESTRIERSTRFQIQQQSRYFTHFPLLQWLLDTVPDAVLILNDHRQIVFANQGLLKLVGVKKPDFLIGMRVGEALNCVHAFESRGGCGATEFCSTCGGLEAIVSSFKGKETVNECRVMQRSGGPLDLQVWATPISLDGEDFTVFAAKDISHEKRRKALERIFFHDVLNTAGVIRGYAELLGDASLDELADLKEQIVRLSARLVTEITSQRELSNAENHELTVSPAAIGSVALLEEIALQYANHPVAEGRYIQIVSHAQAVTFTSDPALLHRVIENMVKNALEAIEPGQTVTLDCQADGDSLEFSVHNPGFMPRRVQLQVFQRSFSTKGEDRGLGTYSMKLLSERYLNGSVSFRSTQKEGTTFWARYPLADHDS